MEDARFFHRCYQLAWQCFDLRVAHKLNLLANEHKGKARELPSQEKDGTPAEELVHPTKTARFDSPRCGACSEMVAAN